MYIDTHCHLSHCFPSFEEALQNIPKDITYLIDISISPNEILSLTQKILPEKILSAFGFYPELCEQWNEEQKQNLKHWIKTLHPLAIGEIGLDYHHHYGTPFLQQRLFIDQLELASLYHKPVLIHSRDAFDDTFSILQNFHPGTPVILHCYGYGPAELEKFLTLPDIYVSFAGNITYPSAQLLRDALHLVPRERLFLETDAPYLSPVPMRGKRNQPDYIRYTYDHVSKILSWELSELCQQIQNNFSRIFLSKLTK
ncbi:TatD family hydrolase [Thermospira aquatica]|uniref:TatD family hydrolase n=1 Tax=Thermospira aquatica TaxID=2828656 RepID=A0AAX3BGB6_9SPIR|nr:TatD family hydrolase [Thermospira aquatica]URA11200.1 TatD family hydrolase [Thermospira aquatica]